LLYRAALLTHQVEILAYGQEVTTLVEVESLAPVLLIIDNVRGYAPEDLNILDALHARPSLASLPIIISTTALPGTLEMSRLQPFSCISILVQPFSYQMLITTVTRALQAGADY
jgi:hypothetical protein